MLEIKDRSKFKYLSFPDADVLNMEVDAFNKHIKIVLDDAWLDEKPYFGLLGKCMVFIDGWNNLKVTMHECENLQKGKISLLRKPEPLKDICEFEVTDSNVFLRGFGAETGEWLEYNIEGPSSLHAVFPDVESRNCQKAMSYEITEKIRKFLKTKYQNETTNFLEVDFLHAFGKESDALFYSCLFMPELIEINSSVLLKWNVETKKEVEGFISQAKEKNKSIEDIEEAYNFIEVGYIFSKSDLNDDDEELLAYRIRDAWEGWLKIQYPNRKFIVRIVSAEEMGSTIGVAFHEERTQIV